MKYVKGQNIDNFCDNPMKQLKEIWSSRMSSSYVDENLLRESLNGKSFLYASVEDKKILGYAIGTTIKLSNLHAEFDNKKVEDVILEHVDSSKGNIGILRTIAVSKGHEGKGIASTVSKKVANDLKRYTKATFSEAWIKPGKVDGSNVLEKIGFNEIYHSQDYWKPKTKKHKTKCPECQSTTCLCPGSLYILR